MTFLTRIALLFGLALSATTPALAQPALSQKAYVRTDLAADGQRLEERLKRDVSTGARPAALSLRDGEAAMARGDARAALPQANAAVVADPNNSAGWRLMARAANAIEPRDYRERWDLRERATTAAYLAYQRSANRNDEAASLAVLARTFEKNELWRPALTTYRLSLDLQDNAQLRASYESLREKRGFRLLSNKVDADAASPRACFVFSEPLARGRVDFAPYVAISGGKGDFAVSAEERQICVDGLRHGERYAFVIRQGVPSAIPDEILLKSADYEVYVRDRTPSVRFTGKNYVLPRTGQQGIPVVSVNSGRLDLEVMRIGDRNLINSVHSDDFLTQLGGYSAGQIASDKGQSVWKGSMEVKSELNKDVITAFPVLEAVGQLQPGVYVMFAKPSGGQATQASDDGDSDYDGTTRATQWFVVSDLGLTSFSGPDGVHVLVRSLANASPVANVELRLVARNNEILATARSDANGYARFDAGLAKGQGGNAPGLVTALAGDDYGFLDLKQTAFDLSDRGVKGRVAPDGLDAYLYTERGVYRSGETVYLTSLLRDARSAAVTGLPLTLVVKRPDGVEYRRRQVEDQGAGGRAYSIPLLSGAQTGTWRVQAYADPKGSVIGETSFLVEDYVPERLELTLAPKTPLLQAGEPAEIDLTARYLYGAPGSELDVNGSTTIRAAAQSAIPGFDGYQVGLTDEDFESVQADLEESSTTDAQGKALVSAAVQQPDVNRPLEVEITLRVGEPGGRAIARSVTLPIVPKGAAIGVKKLFDDGMLGNGQNASFDVIMANGDGRRLSRQGVKWTLSKVTRNYQWFFKDGRWNYEGVKTTRRVADGEIATSETAAANISAPVQWGNYRLDVVSTGSDATETSVSFSVGYESDKTAETPDVLDVALDKASYGIGETMQVRLSPRFAGKATLAVISDRVAEIRTIDIAADGTTASIPVKAEWGASAYLVALAHRPMDAAANRLPGRAIGLSWFSIGKEQRTLAIDLGAPQLVRPLTTLSLPVKVTGARSGEEAFVTVAAVDIGILNLTRYESPDPSKYFFGQRQLGHELRDLYGYLIDGMQGVRGAIRSGGDGAAAVKGEAPTQEPLARYSGVVKVGPDGMAKVDFELPAFNGAVRVMAVAWSAGRTGQASADVVIRDQIVAQATLPRFLAIGDQSRFHLQIDNVEGPPGTYTVDLDVKGPVLVAADATRRSFNLTTGAKTQLTIPVTAAGLGRAEFDVRVTGPNGIGTVQNLAVRVQPSSNTIARRVVRPIPGNGGGLTVSADLMADLVPRSGQVSVSISPFASLDVPAILKALDRYPYGCTEQTVSRALPLLHVNRLASLESLALDANADERVNGAIERVLARQGGNGSFGLWGVGGDDLWLDSFVVDFLTRARERQFNVPTVAFNMALDRLRNQVVNTSDINKEEASGIAYALYVLARNGRPVMGDLRYLADNKLSDFASPLARAQIGAALSLLGDRGRGRAAFTSALATLQDTRDDGLSRADYGSRLRDSTGTLALIAEANGERADITRAASIVEGARNASRYTSTQENMWMVLAAQAMTKEAEGMTLTVDGAERKGALYRTLSQEALEAKPLVIANPGPAAAQAVITVSGIPATPEPALNQGFGLERTIYSMKGEKVDPASLRQNERYVVALTVTEIPARYGRLLLVDPLPAGLEIENANLTEGASTEGLSWLEQKVSPVHTEARDDRYVAAFERSGSSNQPGVFTIGYIVRAVSPGRYVAPAAAIEDMYRPDRFGRTAFGTVDIASAR
ncbi:alpha-2-macroglobulin family protein [Bosea caraganae]|uniref:Alpha-2-macroglobulin family protein n=1 Tax=Bosea caraganae TaxID=2763117 RepID=A0A370L0H8_9HYPH|nr:MG2 domain-containing protein [Bosea caraganae]RDJ20778.1 alpha-2-macroglobulin family protein [Bosea caraganae]RDJ21610.1 alpha-2-macroglobulin family protein [Bosea caraganae]